MNKPSEELNVWLQIIRHDVGTARVLFDQTDYYDVVIYHAHQAVEKTMKAMLLMNEIIAPKTHDIVKLFDICMQEKIMKATYRLDVATLHGYFPELRYPVSDELTMEDARIAIEVMDCFVKLILSDG